MTNEQKALLEALVNNNIDKVVEKIKSSLNYDVDYITADGDKCNRLISVSKEDVDDMVLLDIDELILNEVEELEGCDCGLRDVVYVGEGVDALDEYVVYNCLFDIAQYETNLTLSDEMRDYLKELVTNWCDKNI